MKKYNEQQQIPSQILDSQITLNQNKDQLIIQHNKVKHVIQHFSEQTFIQLNISINPSKIKTMNFNVYQDILSHISNQINSYDLNLMMKLSSNDLQNENRLPQYQLTYSVIIGNDKQQQQQLQQTVEPILVHLGEKIEQISINTYLNGDQNLNQELQILLNQYMDIL